MTKEEWKAFEEKLKEAGYNEYEGSIDGYCDKYYCKSFGRGNNKYHDSRSNYMICVKMYDISKYEPNNKNPIGITPTVMVSRIIDERLDLDLNAIDVENTNIERVESLAESFFKWVEDNISIKKV